jgi:hypothetical protein
VKVPYVGICDFTSKEEILRMADVVRKYRKGGSKRKLMAGVMMSYKTLNNLPTKWANIFPRSETIKDIFVSDPVVLNTLHYADYEGVDVLDSLLRATEFGGPSMNALQLDMVWPSEVVLRDYKKHYPQVPIILQINNVSLQQVGDLAIKLAGKLIRYAGIVDYMLLDKSMGRGVPMDESILREYIRGLMVYGHHSRFGLAVAGGLGPYTMHHVEKIARDYPWISLDAQGQLRTSGNAMDPIDWGMAEQYLYQSLSMFK